MNGHLQGRLYGPDFGAGVSLAGVPDNSPTPKPRPQESLYSRVTKRVARAEEQLRARDK